MKKQLLRVLALTSALLCLACGALASDVPTCPLISWDEYVASSGGWTAADAYGASSCGASAASGSGSSSGTCQSAGGLRWDTGVSSCPSASASQGSSSCGGFSWGQPSNATSGSCSAAQGAAKNNACSGGVYALASCGTCGSTACDGTRCPGQSYTQDENCIFSFGSENDCQTSACQRPSTDYTAQSVSPQESALYQMINDERVANGVGALPLDAELSAIAREKSEDMIENGYFAHESPTYGYASEMLDEFGYSYTSVGENIARNGSVEKAHAALMSSRSHVRNILGSQWKAVGVGVANDANGYPYVTELFVR